MIWGLAFTSGLAAGVSGYVAAGLISGRVETIVHRWRFEARLVSDKETTRIATLGQVALNKLQGLWVMRALTERFKEAGRKQPRARALATVVGFGVGSAVVLIGTGSIIQTAAILAIAGLGMRFRLTKLADNRLNAFAEQLPVVFKAVAGALSAGSSLQQALSHAADQVGWPAVDELRTLNEQIELGMSVEEALAELNRRMPATELDMTILGLAIQRRIGGNLVTLLKQTTESITERRQLHRHLLVETAQARFSARVIGLLPVAITVLVAILDPAYIAPLFTTSTGLLMTAAAVAAEATGFFLLGRILEIKI